MILRVSFSLMFITWITPAWSLRDLYINVRRRHRGLFGGALGVSVSSTPGTLSLSVVVLHLTWFPLRHSTGGLREGWV